MNDAIITYKFYEVGKDEGIGLPGVPGAGKFYISTSKWVLVSFW